MLPGVGVFGTSLTARVIIPLLKKEGFAVKALWGRTQEEAEELAKEMNVPFYTNRIDDVLLHQDVDLVCINLPPPLTRQIAVKTLGESSASSSTSTSSRCRAGRMLRPWRVWGCCWLILTCQLCAHLLPVTCLTSGHAAAHVKVDSTQVLLGPTLTLLSGV